MSGMYNMLMFMGLIQGIKYFDLANEKNLFPIRVAYISVQVLILLLVLKVKRDIAAKNDKKTIKVKGQPQLTNPSAALEEKTMTIREYDESEVRKFLQSTFTTMAIIAFMHFKFGYIQPLILQAILPLKAVFLDSPLFQVHLFGKPAEEKLQRPWIPANPFQQMMDNMNQKQADTTAKEEKKAAKKAKKLQ